MNRKPLYLDFEAGEIKEFDSATDVIEPAITSASIEAVQDTSVNTPPVADTELINRLLKAIFLSGMGQQISADPILKQQLDIALQIL